MSIPFQGTFLAILDRQLEITQSQNPDIGYEKVFFDAYAKYSPEDSGLWSSLWALAVTYANLDLCHAINLARAGGAKLVKSKRYGHMIRPDLDNKNCFWTDKSYKEIQNVFRENEDLILELLKRLGNEVK